MSVYTLDRFGVGMEMFDALPPRLRALVRENPELNPGFILIAMDDEMTEDEIIEAIKGGQSWLTK